jgi:hypothetical protein
MAVKACLLQHTKDPYRENVREAIWNRVEPNSSGVRETSQGMAHFLREWYHDVTDTKTVEVLEEIFNKTFIHHRMLGTGETSRRNERVHALHKIYAEFRFDGTRYRGGFEYLHLRGDEVPHQSKEPFNNEPQKLRSPA